MAKKKNKPQSAQDHRQQQKVKENLWMLRLKVGVTYILIWIIVMAWVTHNLPSPAKAAGFFAESKAHWFMNTGILAMFLVIMYSLGKGDDGHPTNKGDSSEA